MKNSKKNFSEAGQSSTVNKSQKHDANVQKNSSLYFQVGLILCLIVTYFMFEMKFEHKKLIIDTGDLASAESISIDEPVRFKLEVPRQEEQKQEVVRQKLVTDKLEVVDDDIALENIVDSIDDPDDFTPIDTSNLDNLEDNKPEEEIILNFISIENVPIYPGCERFKKNKKRKQCMSDKINRLVQKKFKTDLASDYGLNGIQRIYTTFTINKDGIVSDIKIRAPHPALEKEAQRVITKIPEMKPGMQRDKPVGVIYNLPITFKVLD